MDLVSRCRTFHSSPRWVFAIICVCGVSRECNSAVKRTEMIGLTWHWAKLTSQLVNLYCSTCSQVQPSLGIGAVPAALCKTVNALPCKLVPGLDIVFFERLMAHKMQSIWPKVDTNFTRSRIPLWDHLALTVMFGNNISSLVTGMRVRHVDTCIYVPKSGSEFYS